VIGFTSEIPTIWPNLQWRKSIELGKIVLAKNGSMLAGITAQNKLYIDMRSISSNMKSSRLGSIGIIRSKMSWIGAL
jgi:hypothetical protein